MRRQLNRLTARTVAAVVKTPGMYPDGGGLYLSVAASGTASWILRYRHAGKRPEIGLGSLRLVTLSEARAKAHDLHKVIAAGGDPLATKRAQQRKAVSVTFGDFADEVVESLKAGWKNEKHCAQWKSTLGPDYCGSIRNLSVDAIDTAAVLSVLQPLWTTRPETAARIRGRIEIVLNAAKARGLRSGENPAAWRGHLDHLLPKRQKLSRGHHRALPFAETPAFMGRLRQVTGSTAAKALQFTILAAARTGEVVGADWSEIDLDAGLWVVPAGRMKAGREHIVPLSTRAVALLKETPEANRVGVVFPGAKGGRLSDMSLTMTLRRMNADCTTHGFRSSFRDWCGERTTFPRELAEQALAHAVGDATERAYRRMSGVEQRRALMESWSQFLDGAAAGNVLKLRG